MVILKGSTGNHTSKHSVTHYMTSKPKESGNIRQDFVRHFYQTSEKVVPIEQRPPLSIIKHYFAHNYFPSLPEERALFMTEGGCSSEFSNERAPFTELHNRPDPNKLAMA